MTVKKIIRKKTGGWQLYMLKCSDGSLYTGITNDVERRLGMHNAGTAARYTRSRLPVELIHKEGCRNKSSALKKEYRIKELTRIEKEEYIEARSASHKARTARRKSKICKA